MVRDQLFAALLGAGFHSDAYVIAFRIPNLLRDLFAEGALSSAFVPTFTEYEVRRSNDDAWRLANLVIGVLLVILGSLTLLGIWFAPALVSVIGHGFSNVPGKTELTTQLTRIMFPFLPVVAVSALFMGMLNVKRHFAIPAFAPVMFNLVSIVVGLFLWANGYGKEAAVVGWSIGTLLGGFAQAWIQLPPLWKLGWRFRPTLVGWRESEGLRQIAVLLLPAVIGLSATQINILVNSILASYQEGAPSWLQYAFRLMQLPIGIFGVAIGTVTLPLISRDIANASPESFRKNVTSALTLVFVLTLPSAVGLWVLGEPIVRLIYEHGAFSSASTSATAAALACYAVGLPAYAAVKVIAPALYALKNARVPMVASLVSMAGNIAFNLAVYRTLGYRGLAIGTSLAAMVNFLILIVWLTRRYDGVAVGELCGKLLRIALASTLMAVTAWQVRLQTPGILAEVLFPIAASAMVYFIALKWLRVSESEQLFESVRRIYRRIWSR